MAGHFLWVLVWTGACYWHGVGGFVFNSSSSACNSPFRALVEHYALATRCALATHRALAHALATHAFPTRRPLANSLATHAFATHRALATRGALATHRAPIECHPICEHKRALALDVTNVPGDFTAEPSVSKTQRQKEGGAPWPLLAPSGAPAASATTKKHNQKQHDKQCHRVEKVTSE